MMLHWWSWLLRPTLVRRLLLAQMLLLTVLWSLFIGYAIFETSRAPGPINLDRTYEAIFGVAENLADNPERQFKVLHMIDLAVREGYGIGGDTPKLSPSIRVRQGERLIYQSEDIPGGIHNSRLDDAETIYANGVRWRARTLQSPHSDTRVTIIVPADAIDMLVDMNSRGYYSLPLLISLPFLLLPAWLSIRVALRPWSRIAREVAARGPHNLAPLGFKPKHLELSSMVDRINGLLLRISESVARERNFIADAAHELRTPLAAMRVNAEALQSQAGDSQQQQLLAGILSSSNRATRLVSQLLLLVRSDATASVALDRLAMDTLVQDRLAILSALAMVRHIELELASEGEFFILGHRESLVSLIDNLVDNAIKYSPPGGIVTVGLHRDRDEVVFSVADQGPGIAPALRERVFDRFFRNPDQTQSGSGLGLAIARSVVLQHGGQIQLHAAGDEQGLLVEVRFPLA
ncbi:two-component system sensor histidine kinase QseC [Collimonas sp. PA-H2]|uniref:sensor histidine kinase n=1 Tax=Collimonas sp. PA-H2 TaxID=1881062 RepID=UPI000BF9181A|nr:ATP-binding protein [Collimonas sp. PA-H2]PFH09906.1 two-component system sensor histidine kinase QseC [Collimonas sp. PA-H2]